MSLSMAWEIVVPQSEQPKRLENFLKKRFPIGYVRKLFRRSGVRLNGKRSGPNEFAGPGDRIELFIPFEQRESSAAEKTLPRTGFEILFEDEDLLVINKQPGIAVHEGREIPKRHSLLGMLEATYGPRGVRLVHRIDKETSGLLVVAKRDRVAEELGKLFDKGDVHKDYLALVVGRLHPRKGRIDSPLPGREGKAVRAVTLYEVEKEFPETTLVLVRIETGRMHQIRLHFAKLGHPIVLDGQHGDFAFNKQFRKIYGLKRQFLHARSIAFDYRGKKRRWTAPLPADLARTLKSLEAAR